MTWVLLIFIYGTTGGASQEITFNTETECVSVRDSMAKELEGDGWSYVFECINPATGQIKR